MAIAPSVASLSARTRRSSRERTASLTASSRERASRCRCARSAYIPKASAHEAARRNSATRRHSKRTSRSLTRNALATTAMTRAPPPLPILTSPASARRRPGRPRLEACSRVSSTVLRPLASATSSTAQLRPVEVSRGEDASLEVRTTRSPAPSSARVSSDTARRSPMPAAIPSATTTCSRAKSSREAAAACWWSA